LNPADPPLNGSDFQNFALQAATVWGSKVIAWEMWITPNDPNFFTGTPRNYRERILIPGVAGIRASPVICSNALIVAPDFLTHGGTAAGIKNWVKRCVGGSRDKDDCSTGCPGGSCQVIGGIDRLSINTGGESPGTVESELADMTNIINGDGSLPSTWWLDEYGFSNTTFGPICGACNGSKVAGPGGAYNDVRDYCLNNTGGKCERSFADFMDDRWPCNCPDTVNCDLGLLKQNGCARAKMCTIAAHLGGSVTCPSTCPAGSCCVD